MRIKLIFSLSILTALVLGSCASSNEVVGGGIFQKRKFNKGFYWNRGSNLNESASANDDKTETVVYEESTSEKKNRTVASASASNETVTAATETTETERNYATSTEDAAVETNEGTTHQATVSENEGSVDQATTDADTKVSKTSKKKQSAPGGDANTILLVILAILIPPLAVFLFEGASNRFWIDLILALIGWGVGFWLLGGLGWVCGLAAIIYALLIVLSVI